MRHNWIFRHTCRINNPHRESDRIITFLGKYYIVISDTLVGSFLDVLFLLLALIFSGFREKPRRNKDWVTEKSTYNNLCEGHAFFDCKPYFLCDFLLLSLSSSLSKWRTCWMAPIKIYNIAMGGNLYDDIMSERLKTWKSLAI